MSDMFADNLVRRVIGRIIEHKDTLPDEWLIWKQLTKVFIKEKGLLPMFQEIENITKELADIDWFENKYPPEIFKEKKEIRRYKTNDKVRDLINTKIKITDVAKSYGLDTDKKGKTTCPFHYDTEPSLMLSDKKNVFYCFGCHAKGDIITFKKKMEEIKSGNKKGS